MTAKRADPSFVKRGFSYWKDATIAFKKHESSDCHKEAVHVSIVLPEACHDVGEMLSSQHAHKRNRAEIAFSSFWLGKESLCTETVVIWILTLNYSTDENECQG